MTAGSLLRDRLERQLTRDVLEDVASLLLAMPPDMAPTPVRIVHAVESLTGVSFRLIACKRRHPHVVYARHLAWWLCRRVLDRSYPWIAERFGVDHSAVMHGVRRIEETL